MSAAGSGGGTGAVPVALLGLGQVGRALLARWPRVPAASALRLVLAANSRHAWHAPRDGDTATWAGALPPLAPTTRGPVIEHLREVVGAGGIIVDATASDAVAACHRQWLEQGLRVVTANKAATGGDFAAYQAVARHADRYGDSATVGAGLPLLQSIRRLRAGGDRVSAVAGVLSGTLAWLFDRYDGEAAFSTRIDEARALGYSEPDPRVDLSGQDVQRKLLILARAAGAPLEPAQVRLASLLPPALATGDWASARANAHALDDAVHARWREAQASGRRLRFVARWAREGGARIGLEALAPDDPLWGGRGCDNRVAIWSCRYREQPLVVQGPGAGAEVTAAALLDDLLRQAEGAAAGAIRTAA